jgi:hypothetical protein
VLVLQFHALTQIAPSSSHLHPPPPLSLLSKSKSVVIAVWTRELAVVGLLIARWSLLSNLIGFRFPPILTLVAPQPCSRSPSAFHSSLSAFRLPSCLSFSQHNIAPCFHCVCAPSPTFAELKCAVAARLWLSTQSLLLSPHTRATGLQQSLRKSPNELERLSSDNNHA